jgi:glucosamine-6-phosphate deaminase
VLKSLAEDSEIEWNRINAYHMDEYIGLSKDAPQGFGNFLKAHIFDLAPFKSVNYIDCTATDPEAEAERYGKLLLENPTDVVIMGIGENGHIAFNDPPADFEDQNFYKVVSLSDTCLEQQMHEGWFASKDEAFKQAISMTCSKIMDCKTIISAVPYKVKAKAIHDTLTMEETNLVPATLMKKHADCTVYVDPDSASMVNDEILAQYK